MKITIYTQFLVYDTLYVHEYNIEDITHITNYENYFKSNEVSNLEILNVIKEFKDYYDKQKIEMLILHLNKNLKVDKHESENENKYNELLNKFDVFDFEIKNSLNSLNIF